MAAQAGSQAQMSRRGFLGWAFALSAGIVTLVAGVPVLGALLGTPAKAKPHDFVEVGKIADLPVGEPTGLTFVAESTDAYNVELLPHNVWALKDAAGGVTVFSPVCTHLGCQVAWNRATQQFVCPCHNSVFTKEGAVVSGPAPRSLDTLPSEIKDGALSVQWVDYAPGVPTKTSV